MKLTAWGNHPVVEADTTLLRDAEQIKGRLNIDGVPVIFYGSGRSYGDQALGSNVILTGKYNYITEFDKHKGIITCQSGVTLEEILDVIVPEGWFLPVTPGTKHITVGGAVASDVHGKNHHKDGTFCDHVVSFTLMLPGGEIVTGSKQNNRELFKATCGGGGLTGLILSVTFLLRPVTTAYIKQRTIKAAGIDQLIEILNGNESYTYSVAWIDCLAAGRKLGRGVLLLGEHAEVSDLKKPEHLKAPLKPEKKIKLNVPLFLPGFALNKLSIKMFNRMYYSKAGKGVSDSITDYNSFFYPLDTIDNWNRIYGKRGFSQYQFVIPEKSGAEGLKEIVRVISGSGMGSFLAVLKTFGPFNGNYLSFPMQGYTLALDFPLNKRLFHFFRKLDKLVEKYGGRLYTTKDVSMDKHFYKKSYPLLPEFMKVRKRIKADKKIMSIQSGRLEI